MMLPLKSCCGTALWKIGINFWVWGQNPMMWPFKVTFQYIIACHYRRKEKKFIIEEKRNWKYNTWEIVFVEGYDNVFNQFLLFVYQFQRPICTWKEKPGVDSTVPSEQPGTDTRESEQRRGIQGYNSSRTKTTHGRKTRTACQVSWVAQRTKQFQLVYTLIWSCSV